MPHLDIELFRAVNGVAGNWALLDEAVRLLTGNHLLKGIPVMVLWWGLWFWSTADQVRMRAGLLSALFCALVAIFVGRGLNLALPFRYRPMHDPGMDATLPIGATERMLDGWSSMPSDHAVLFFALAAGLFAVHRAVGYVLLAHATFVVGLPRVFMGYHYPSDILVGAFVGCLIVALAWARGSALIRGSRFFELEKTQSHIVYPLLFLLTYEAGTMFEGSRTILSGFFRALQMLTT